MIRRASVADIPRILEMGREHHVQAGNPGVFDDAAAGQYVRAMIEETGAVFMSPGGQIGGVLAPVYCAPSHVMAVELFWFSIDGTGGRLLAAFEAWAREAGAHQIVMSTVLRHGGQRVGDILMRKGYAPQEISFAKDIT